jgi:UMF1 family MFS transporter
MSPSVLRKDVIGWSLYDFANTIYSMNIVSLYLKRYIVEDLGYGDRYYDIPFAASMALAAVLLPALGALSDHGSRKRLFVILFTLACCTSVGLMAIVPVTLFALMIVLFVIANFSYEAAQPFYNALLYSVADDRKARFVSGIGVSFGYIGSIIGMMLVLPFVSGDLFGIDIPFIEGSGKPAAFIPTALLFALFSIPLFLWVKERPGLADRTVSIRRSYAEVWQGIRETRRYPGVLRFLIADYFFEDAVATVIINIGLYCSIVLQMNDSQINAFLIISTTSAVIGSFVVGKIAERVSLKRLVTLVVWGWVVALIAFVTTDSMPFVWVLGSVVGILLGGLWTTTRPMLAELVPRGELGRFFGLFALSGRAAAVVGPLVWTSVILLFQPDMPLGRLAVSGLGLEGPARWLPYKAAVLSLAVLMLIGLVIFRRVPETARRSDG